jgi:hypothetical protein
MTMTMKYTHLAPKHLREEMAKTEKPVEIPAAPAPNRAQAGAQEAVAIS